MIGSIKNLLVLCDRYYEIENYNEAISSDKFYEVHHRLETHNSDGSERLVQINKDELRKLHMYYHRPPEELIFLSRRDHNYIHKKYLTLPHGHITTRGRKWYTNGHEDRICFSCPEGFHEGRSKFVVKEKK